MKTFPRAAVISAALLSLVIGPGAAPAQPVWPRLYVHSYTFYSDPAHQNVVGYGTGYCHWGEEYIALVYGQFGGYSTREPYGWCDGDTIIYE